MDVDDDIVRAQGTGMISDQLLSIFITVNLVVISAILGITGIVFNIFNIIVFASIGLSDTTNISLLGRAVADIGVLMTMVGFSVVYNPLMLQVTPFETIDAVNYVVMGTTHVMCCRIAGCLTAFITVERFLCVAFPLHIKSIITPRRTALVVVTIYTVIVSSTMPQFLANQIAPRYNPQLNITIDGIVLSPNADKLENFTLTVDIVAQVTSFIVVTVSTLGLVRSLVSMAKWRSSTSSSSQSSQVLGRDKQLVKMVLLISMVFIVCSLPTVVGNLVMVLVKDFNIKGKNKNLFVLVCSSFFTFDAINSTINIFIYLRMSSKFREKLWSISKSWSEDISQCRIK